MLVVVLHSRYGRLSDFFFLNTFDLQLFRIVVFWKAPDFRNFSSLYSKYFDSSSCDKNGVIKQEVDLIFLIDRVEKLLILNLHLKRWNLKNLKKWYSSHPTCFTIIAVKWAILFPKKKNLNFGQSSDWSKKISLSFTFLAS